MCLSRTVFHIEPRYRPTLEKLGLDSLARVMEFQGERLKEQRGRRDVLRVQAATDDGRKVTLFVKRMWKSYKKDGFRSLFTRGRVISKGRKEYENTQKVLRAGFAAPSLVAYGEDCGLARENCSFIITEEVRGQPLDEWLAECTSIKARRHLIAALGRWIAKLHDAGIAYPDIFSRHIFVHPKSDPAAESIDGEPGFALIDLARLAPCRWPMANFWRVRDLAALNASLTMRQAGKADRIRFLRAYCGNKKAMRRLIRRIAARMKVLLEREKFADFYSRPTKALST